MRDHHSQTIYSIYLSVLDSNSLSLLYKIIDDLHSIHSTTLSVLYSESHALLYKSITYTLSSQQLYQPCIQIVIHSCTRWSLTNYHSTTLCQIYIQIAMHFCGRSSLTVYPFHKLCQSCIWIVILLRRIITYSPIHPIALSALYSDSHILLCKIITHSLSISQLCQFCIQIALYFCARSSLTPYPFHNSVSPVFR
jgi:hypothetical protein